MVGATDMGAWWLLWLIGTGISMAIASAAGRGRGSMWWGLLGPIGWIIAAIHSIDPGESLAARAAARVAPSGSSSDVPCVRCTKLIQRGRTVCTWCGEPQE